MSPWRVTLHLDLEVGGTRDNEGRPCYSQIVTTLRRAVTLPSSMVGCDLLGLLGVLILISKFDSGIKLKLIPFGKLKLNCQSFMDLYLSLFFYLSI